VGFLFPSVPKPLAPANPGVNPKSTSSDPSSGSLISPMSASPSGLKRKDTLNKSSLIGGG